jgi:hypothetical protein
LRGFGPSTSTARTAKLTAELRAAREATGAFALAAIVPDRHESAVDEMRLRQTHDAVRQRLKRARDHPSVRTTRCKAALTACSGRAVVTST